MKRAIPSAIVCVLALATLAWAGEPSGDAGALWPQWRGPSGSGSAHGDPPVEWSETRNVRWKIDVPGKGSSSPIVWGDRIYVTTAVPAEGGGQASAPPAARRGAGSRRSSPPPRSSSSSPSTARTVASSGRRRFVRSDPRRALIPPARGPRTRPSPTGRISTPTSAPGVSTASTWTATSSGRGISARWRRGATSARAARRCCSATRSSSCGTTRAPRSSSLSTRRPARTSGRSAGTRSPPGPRPWPSSTEARPRSSPTPPARWSATTRTPARCSGTPPA